MKRALVLAALVAGATSVLSLPAGADPVNAGSASAFAASVSAGGTEVVPPTPLAEVALPPGGDVSETTVDVPAEPVAVNGTLNADAAAHGPSDLASTLTVESQAVDGPYNVRAVALIEDADVLLDAAGEGVSLVSASAVRAEAVAVCRGGSVQYAANSEIIDLDAGGEDIPANAPVTELVDAISGALADAGLDAVVDVRRNVVSQLDGGGIAVDALVISAVTDGGPLALVTIGHAEVSAATCGAGGAATTPACSDGVDNGDAEDTLADADDPGCHSDGDATNAGSFDPDDTDETDDDGGGGGSGSGIGLECADGADNDDPEDELADIDDPGCHSDGDASNVLSFDPTRASEVDESGGDGAGGGGAGEPGEGGGDDGGAGAGDPGDGGTGGGTLPQTGGNEATMTLTAAALGAAGLGLHLVRRRLSVQ
jgi:LPXTG-motif cell wall-anchored protein